MEKVVAFYALVGSHNYNLAGPDSDKDYKVFTLPTFEDLYHGTFYSHSEIGKEADYDYHDIRKLTGLWWRSNINFIEVLYSTDIQGGAPYLLEIFDMRKELVAMNLPYLYKACGGMFFNKMKYIEKGTEGTMHLVEKYGYDTKQALHAYRVLDFIERFADTDFEDFKAAMEYRGIDRNYMLGIKNGMYVLDHFKQIVSDKFDVYKTYEKRYLDQPTKPEVKERLEELIMAMVRRNLGV